MTMNFPTQREGDGHSATVETLTHRVSVLPGNIQIGDTVDLVAGKYASQIECVFLIGYFNLISKHFKDHRTTTRSEDSV